MTDTSKGGRGLKRPMPADFVKRAPALSLTQAKRAWKTNVTCIKRWHAEAGTSPKPAPLAGDPPPPGFHNIARLSLRQLSTVYGITKDRATRWRAELGIVVPRVQPAAPKSASTPKPAAARRGHWGVKAPAAIRDDSAPGLAAEALKRAGYIPVCRARIRDPKAPADHWIVGRRTLPEAEMMRLAAERARRVAA